MENNYALKDVPTYPDYESLSLKHKGLIDTLNTKQKIQHSSSNFTNLFILDINNDTYVTKVNDILLIQQQELFSSRSMFLVLDSDGNSDKTIQKLSNRGINNIVMFPYKFTNSKLDEDNSDYIYDIKDFTSLTGSKYAAIRRKINAFSKYGSIEFKKIPQPNYEKLWELSDRIYKRAMQNAPKQREALEIEKQALEKVLSFSKVLNVSTNGFYVNNSLVGFTITEHSANKSETALIHFFRIDLSYKGISESLFYRLGEYYKDDAKFINFEQDLGIPGLRKFKQYLNPSSVTKVYSQA